MTNKFTPRNDKEYIVTDQCFWEPMSDEERNAYNPYDPKRAPHSLQLVCIKTGTIVNLPSGSIIKIIKLGDEKKSNAQ